MKSDPPSAPETLELLERFQSSARSFAEREQGLSRARQLRESSHRQSLEEKRTALERKFRSEAAARREETEARLAAIDETIRHRRARIDKAQIAIRNRVVADIQAVEGQHRAALQRDYMNAGRHREQVLAEATARHEAESTAARTVHSRFLKLEKAALSALRGWPSLQRQLILQLKDPEAPALPPGAAPTSAALDARFSELSAATSRLRRHPLVAWFSALPLVIQIFGLLAVGGLAPVVAPHLGLPAPTWALSLAAAGGAVALVLVLWGIGRATAKRFASEHDSAFAEAKTMRLRQREAIETDHRITVEKAEAEYNRVKSAFEQGLKAKPGRETPSRYPNPEAVERRGEALRKKLDVHRGLLRARLERKSDDDRQAIERSLADALTKLETEAGAPEDSEEPFARLLAEWESDLIPLANHLSGETLAAERGRDFAWLAAGPAGWTPPASFAHTLAFGEADYDEESSGLLLPASPLMHLPVPARYRLPLRLRIPDAASLLIETKSQGRAEAIRLLNYLVLGWLASSPPGRLSFSLFDPVGLGESFAGLMHLADYEEILIHSRIRTQPDQIERRLGELCDHMEKVIQMYLRTDYGTIAEYNEAAGTIAERYHFVVVADFPTGFSDLALRRLLSIAASGARCGVFLLLHWDRRTELPHGFRPDDLHRACVGLQSGAGGFALRGSQPDGLALTLAQTPAPDVFAEWVHRIGAANRDSNRIEVPFSFIAPSPDECWTLGTADELRVPIGRSGATKLQYLALGKGTCQHALIAGKTGSGKSTLFHIIVSNLALWCPPDEVEFYLIDFKKGVEFKCYADQRLPHARVIAIESDREFGLSVLQRLDEELRSRGEKFRAAGVQDLSGYRSHSAAETMPRTLLLIDEFQEFFTEDDAISQQAAVLLDRIVRQGRAFGIHAILGSQTLGGAFTLARATLGQMTVRIALACNEADAYLIMDDSNPAPRLLTRPGEGIYNDRAGAAEANSPFQVVWMEEEERGQLLAHLSGLAKARSTMHRDLVVFEGNAPAEVESDPFVAARLERGTDTDAPPTLHLGAPNSIKGPTEIRFARQSGNHLLFVGQREDAVDALVLVSLRLLRAQFGDRIRLVLIDSRASGSERSAFGDAVRAIGGIECPDAHSTGPLLNSIAADLKAVAEGSAPDTGRPVVVFLPNLHRHRKLRHEEDFSFSMDESPEAKPSDSLQQIILEGPPWGYHLVTSLDSCNNVVRCLGRKAAGEFEKKVLFQMSAADSASLIDSGKAAELGLNRALAYDETSGEVEIFRPYSMPGLPWFS